MIENNRVNEIACQLLPVIAHNGQLRSSIVLIQVETEKIEIPDHDWPGTRDGILEVLRGCIRAGGDLLLPITSRGRNCESFLVVASIDLERAQIMLQRIRERMSGASLPGLHSIKVSAKGIWLPNRSGSESLASLSREIAEEIMRAAQLEPERKDEPQG